MLICGFSLPCSGLRNPVHQLLAHDLVCVCFVSRSGRSRMLDPALSGFPGAAEVTRGCSASPKSPDFSRKKTPPQTRIRVLWYEPPKGSARHGGRKSNQMHKTACDQLIFVGNAVLRQAYKLVGERRTSYLRGDSHSSRSIISRPCSVEGPREQEL
jgi:hypothetical protein